MGCFKAVCRSEGKVLEQASSYSRTVPVVVVGLLQALAKQDQARPKEKKAFEASKGQTVPCSTRMHSGLRCSSRCVRWLVRG